MNISLKKIAQQNEPVACVVTLQERLPHFIHAPCEVHCKAQVTKYSDHFQLNLQLQADLWITCQRCLRDFLYHYDHPTELALCRDEETAAQKMAKTDAIVQSTDELDLIAIVTDDLHLFCPEKHELLADCSG